MPGHELLTAAEMGQADALAIASGVPGLELMENAGAAVAEAADRMAAGESLNVAVICGPGNNGGDGFVAARLLRDGGHRVRLGLLGARAGLKGDAAAMAARWGDAVEPLSPDTLAGADLIIDALFGAGLARPLEGVAADVVAAANASGQPILAVDVPSGLDGSTGRADGPVIQATETVTFFRLKPGHLLLPGRALCGTVHLADIGIPDAVLDRIGPRTAANRPSLWRTLYPWPRLDGHKYTRGHAVVISGPPESTGAARMGARAALRVGAGLVTVAGSPAATAINATHETAVMVRAMASDGAIADFLCRRAPQRGADRTRRRCGTQHGGNGGHHSRLARRRRARRRCAHLLRRCRGRGAGARHRLRLRAARRRTATDRHAPVRGDPARARRLSSSPRTPASSSACSASWPARSSRSRAAPLPPAARS